MRIEKTSKTRVYDFTGTGVKLANLIGLDISKTKRSNLTTAEMEARERRISKDNIGYIENLRTDLDRAIMYLKGMAGQKVVLEPIYNLS
jgi:hypothetical protein